MSWFPQGGKNIPRTSPYSLTLTDAERTQLEARARRYTSPYSEVIRAKIVLYAAEGLGNDEIAARLDTPRQVVSKWRKRFFDERLAGLTDLPRGERPPSFPPDVMVAIKALACEFPATADPPQPLARWQCPDLARAAVESGIVAAISGHHHLALAEFGRDQALATPVLDLPPRPRTDGSESPPGPLRSQLHRRRCVVEDADDVPAGVMLAVRLRRVGRAACDYDAGGVNVAGAADNGVVIVHWIRVCHCMFPFYG